MSILKSIRKFIDFPKKLDLIILLIQSIPFILGQLLRGEEVDLQIEWDNKVGREKHKTKKS